ncbi:MAG TPA: ATP-binding cassette domain-containing protein [Chloroflexia bacterium]|nr:ATP-binding cassette domain-containing protein [Chloroflexia bacterium]
MPVPPLLQVTDLYQPAPREARSGRPALESISLELAPGEQVAILGPLGSGKTRLARALALIEPPKRGRILFEGHDISRAGGGKLRGLRRRLQFLGGHPRQTLSPRLSIAHVLAEPLQVQGLGSPSERLARVAAAAAAWHLNAHLLGERAINLSLGLCQRVAVARAFMLEPRLLVCDELVERLEPALVRTLLRQVAEACRATGAAWLWTTSDPVLANEFATRVLRLENGRLSAA